MKLRNAFLCLFLSVTSLCCGSTPCNRRHFFLDASELKFIYMLDQIYRQQPNELDFLFLSGFDMHYLEWKGLFLDELQTDFGIEDGNEFLEENVEKYRKKIVLINQIPIDKSR